MSVSLRPIGSGSRYQKLGSSFVAWPFCAAFLIFLSVEAVGADAYIPYSGIESGTDGQFAMELRLHNLGPNEMVCTAQLAHWYSAPLGVAASGDTIVRRVSGCSIHAASVSNSAS